MKASAKKPNTWETKSKTQAMYGTANRRGSMPLGCKTRWGSHLRLFKKLVERKQSIIQVLSDPEANDYVDGDLHDTCFCASFWVELNQLIDILMPITEVLTILEGDTCISNVAFHWKKLENFFDPTSTSSLIDIATRDFVTNSLDERWNMFEEYIHWASFILDPRFRQEHIDFTDYENGEFFIKKFTHLECPEEWRRLNNQLLKFRTFKDMYNEEIEMEEDPKTFWVRLAASSGRDNKLVSVALKVLSFPASAAAVERSFSCVRRIHTWQRNRLEQETLAKLVYIYLNNRALAKQSLLTQ